MTQGNDCPIRMTVWWIFLTLWIFGGCSREGLTCSLLYEHPQMGLPQRWWGQIKTRVFSITRQISIKEKYFKIWQDNKRISIQGSSFLRENKLRSWSLKEKKVRVLPSPIHSWKGSMLFPSQRSWASIAVVELESQLDLRGISQTHHICSTSY